MILLMDQNERVIGHLDNEAPKACPYYSDSWKRDRDTGASTYEFYCPADHPMSGNVKKNGFIVRPNFRGELMQFQIARIEERHENGILSKFVYCEFAWAELNGEIVRPYNLEGVTADYALTYALSGTRYQPGKIEYTGHQSLASDAYDTSLKMCHDIKDAFGGEIQFRVVMKNGQITGRYVDLLDRVGANRGKTIIFGKNLTSATRLHDRTTVATALIGVGKGDAGGDQLTFTTYVWRKADGAPVDKPAGQDWVGDPGALAQWGINGRHVTKVFEYATTSKQVLLQQTWKELQRVKNGVLQYEADAAFLDRFGFDWERTDIGDDVLIQDLYFEPPLMVNARIITLEQSFTDPKAQSATFGDYEEARSNVGRLADIQSTLLKKETQWDEAAQGKATILRDANRPTPAPNHIWLDPATDARPFDIMYTYNEDTNDWQRATALTPEEIGADRAGAAEAARQAAVKAAADDAERKANAAQAAAESLARAEALAAENAAKAHADGKISAEEAARIAQDAANLEAARLEAATKATAAENAAILAAGIDATKKAQDAQDAAEALARQEAATAQTNAQAHADGLITAEEAARIQQAADNLAAAKLDAQTKANAAEAAAVKVAAADAEAKAGAAQRAAELVAANEAAAAQEAAAAYADGILSDEEAERIQAIADALAAAKLDATQKANAAELAAVNAASLDATQKANAAQLAAENLAIAEADAAQTLAQTYADGKVTAEENARLAQAATNLKAAKDDATAKANAAQTAAIEAARLDATSKANAAQTAAEQVAAAQAAAAEEAAKAHADGIVTAEEQARINQAAANLETAKTDAQTKATAAETAAKEYARLEAQTQSGNAQQNAELRAQYEGRLAEYQGYLNSVGASIDGLQSAADAILVWPERYTAETIAEVEGAMVNIALERGTFRTQLDEAIAEGVFTAERIARLDEAAWYIEQRMAEAERTIMRATQDAGGLRIGTLTGITVQVNRAGLTADGTTSGAVRIWAGATYAGRNAAPFRVLDNGQLYTSNIEIVGGSINIATDATIGRNLYLGALGDYAAKRISFNAGAYIQATDYSIDVVGGRLNLQDNYNAGMSTDGGALYLDGNILDVNIGYVSFTNEMKIGGLVNVNGPLRANGQGMSANDLAGAGSSTYITPGSGGQWTTNTKETGFCGLQTESNGSTYTVGMGIAVNFKTIKDYTPSSVSISRTSGNLANSALFLGYITPYGFWIQITRANASSNAAWRGTYTA